MTYMWVTAVTHSTVIARITRSISASFIALGHSRIPNSGSEISSGTCRHLWSRCGGISPRPSPG
jgi:hypothetical protein